MLYSKPTAHAGYRQEDPAIVWTVDLLTKPIWPPFRKLLLDIVDKAFVAVDDHECLNLHGSSVTLGGRD